jgi:predicted GIY-YIG superfamily endonuclease
MVHWVYVVECEEGHIYIGETKRLYRRFNEHLSGNGSVNTGKHKPNYLVGLYKVSDNESFMQYRDDINNNEYNKCTILNWGMDESSKLEVENHITEIFLYLRTNSKDGEFMFEDGEWEKVRGGKYTKDVAKNPISKMDVKNIIDRPCCECGYPCEVKISKDKKTIYFVCSLKNTWDAFFNGLEIAEKCEYYKVYTEDVYIKKQNEINEKRLKEYWCNNLPTEFNACIKCKIIQYNMIYSYGVRRQLCQRCFSNKYEELKEEYSAVKCLIMDD